MSFLASYTDSSRTSSAAEILALSEAIKSGNRHVFLQPKPEIPNASLQLAKSTLDAYAGQISHEQQVRQKEFNKKRKRGNAGLGSGEILKIRKLHVDGFESGQVWQQARRIISSALQDSREALQSLQDADEVEINGIDGDVNGSEKILQSGNDGHEVGTDEDDVDSEEDLEGVDEDEDDEAQEDDEDFMEDRNEVYDQLGDLDDEDLVNGHAENGLRDLEDEQDADEDNEEVFEEDPNGLNDGFFSIDEFNKQSQWFEDQDMKADPNTDAGSENEDIDWHNDPLAGPPVASRKNITNQGRDGDGYDEESSLDEDDEEDEEDGPTFGDMDLNAPEGESDQDEADQDLENDEFNANDLFYKDFFAPPARKASKEKKVRRVKEPAAVELDDQDVDRAMADVRRDLFDDESEREDSEEDALSDVSAGDPKSRKSAHERRQAKLAEEIRQLEAANVAEKRWTLAGEARASDRPKHSLLDEELDFEHIGKPVPVITAEVSESIEDMIKRRILAQEFDEVTKRRPDSLDPNSGNRRGLIELDGTKGKQSLAELYEEEHVKNANPDAYISKSDEKLRKEEHEIEQMWKDISGKLDALSSWHYKPKPAAPSLTVVSDVATIAMEDAQPTTAQGVGGGDNTLAPQEIYKAGKESAEQGEIVAKSGLPIAKQEMEREDKVRRRRRDKERIRKAGGFGDRKVGGKAREQQQTMGDLKKGGVKVINKKGEVLDMEGKKAKASKSVSSGSFKL